MDFPGFSVFSVFVYFQVVLVVVFFQYIVRNLYLKCFGFVGEIVFWHKSFVISTFV